MKKSGLLVVAGTFIMSMVASGCSQSEKPHTHNFVEHAAKAATCVAEGNEAYFTCDGCDKMFNSAKEEISQIPTVAKLGHHYVDVAAKGATCTENGNTAYSYCDVCEKYFSADHQAEIAKDSWVINANGHHFVDVLEADPTCEEAGNTAYSYCDAEGCGKYFDITHKNEIEKDSWVIPALDHSFALRAVGTFKTDYDAKETFDASGLTLEKYCVREAECEHIPETISSYEVVYENGGNSFAYGDSKVTLQAGDLSVDIEVSVAKLENVIIGAEESYEIHCKEGVDLTEISATNGVVEVSYFSDAERTMKIDEDDLVGGAAGASATYYGTFSAKAVDDDYEDASADFLISVSHEESDTPVDLRERIGHLAIVCEDCGAYIKDADTKIEEFDILDPELLTPETGGYQISAFSRAPENPDPGEGRSPFAPGFVLNENGFSLPAVEYTAYGTVVYSTSIDTWGSMPASFGINENNDLLDNSTGKMGKLIISVIEEGAKLQVRYTDDKGSDKTVVVEDSDIITGVKPLKFIATSQSERTLSLNKLLLGHNEHSFEYVDATDRIGRKVGVCECGEISSTYQVGSSVTSWTTEKINAYGSISDGVNADGTVRYTANSGTSEGDKKDWNFSLPRMDVKTAGRVTLVFTSSFVKDYPVTTKLNGEVVVAPEDAVESTGVVMDFEYVSDTKMIVTVSATANEAVKTIEITDTDMIVGDKNIPFTIYGNAWRWLGLKEALVNHTHDGEAASSNIKIGHKVKKCSVCGFASYDSSLMTVDDVNFYLGGSDGYSTTSYGCGFGVKNSLTWAVAYPVTTNNVNGSRPEKDGQPDFDTPTKYLRYGLQPAGNVDYAGISSIYIPKVDFTAYKEVVYSIKTNTNIKLGFASDAVTEFPQYGEASVSVVVTNIDGVVKATVVSNYLPNLFVSKVIDDQAIITGAKPIELFASTKAYGNICLSVTKLADEHTHMPYFSDDLIGGEAKCSTCGVTLPDVKFDPETIDLNTKLYGASISNVDEKKCYVENNGGKILYNLGVDGEQNQYTVNFPRVNFNGYEEVVFDLNLPSGWFTFGFSAENKSNTIKDHCTGTLDVVKQVSGGYKAFLKLASSEGTHADISEEITDADVLSGAKGLAMWSQAGNVDREIHITGIHLNDECEHVLAYDLGGHISDTVTSIGCIKCGKEDTTQTRPIQTSDINYQIDNLGTGIEYIGTQGWSIPSAGKTEDEVKGYKANTTSTYASDSIAMKPGIGGANYKASLPKVDYSKFGSVSFPINLDYGTLLYYGLSFSTQEIWNEKLFPNHSSSAKTGTIVIEPVDLNKLHITVSVLESVYEETVTVSSDIFTGVDSLPMYFSPNHTGPLTIGRPTLTAHKHVVTDFSYIGQTKGTCAICGETDCDCTFDMSSVDLRENNFGASVKNISAEDPTKGASVLNTGTNPIALCFGEEGVNDKFEISLPKVNYNAYSKVTFNTKFCSGWLKIGFNESDAQYGKTDNLLCSLIVEKIADGEYKATLAYNGTQSDAFTLETTITDADILSGQKGLTMFAQNFYSTPARQIDIISIDLD